MHSLLERPNGGLTSGSLTVALVEFCRVLNDYGIFVPPGSTHVALAAINAIDIGNRSCFQQALCATLVNRPEDIPVFNVLFAEYWRIANEQKNATDQSEADETEAEPEETETSSGAADDELVDDVLQRFSLEDFWADDKPDDVDEPGEEPNDNQDLAPGVELETARTNDPRELQRIVRALAEHFARQRSRRFENHQRGTLINLRKTMRDSLKHGGLPIELRRRRRRVVRTRLLLFVDVSRSMASYAKLLLQFVAAVLRHAWQVEVYLFATNMVRITHQQLEDNEVDVNKIIADCGGGTRIGENLRFFEENYGHALTGNQSIAIVLSDGLDSGESEELGRAMSQLRRRTRQVIWLNPLLELQGHEASSRGMEAAMPYIDVLAPAHDVACFWRLLEILRNPADARAA